jgi:multidrug resistance efflux pump
MAPGGIPARFLQSTDDAYVGGDISAISAKVSGYIQEIAIKDNMPVKKGELLVRLDARDYQAALAKAKVKLPLNKRRWLTLLLPDNYNWRPSKARRPASGPRRLLR